LKVGRTLKKILSRGKKKLISYIRDPRSMTVWKDVGGARQGNNISRFRGRKGERPHKIVGETECEGSREMPTRRNKKGCGVSEFGRRNEAWEKELSLGTRNVNLNHEVAGRPAPRGISNLGGRALDGAPLKKKPATKPSKKNRRKKKAIATHQRGRGKIDRCLGGKE